MSDVPDRTMQMLSTALGLEEKGKGFYSKAVSTCHNAVGKEIFRMLMKDEVVHMDRIRQIYKRLEAGESWSDEWKSIQPDHKELSTLFREVASAHGREVTSGAGDIEAIDVGIEMADRARTNGTVMIASGEMGIGNTTPSSAVFSALLPADVIDVTGRGTGLDEDGLKHKVDVIKMALKNNQAYINDPISTLAAVGGLEIAAICGLCLGGAALRMIVVVDGFISSAGALVAMRLNPTVKDYLFFSHQSFEKGHRAFFEKEGLRPILDLDLRLGEGTGAALGMQLIEDSVRIYDEMATFKEVGIEPGA